MTTVQPPTEPEPFEGFDAWLRGAVNGLARQDRRSSGASDRSGLAAALYDRRVEDLEDLAFQTWHSRSVFEPKLAEDRSSAFAAFDSAVGLAAAALRLVEPGRIRQITSPPADVTYATVALGVQSQALSHEIAALLRAGFPTGAHARWRTLYEVQVVAGALSIGTRHTYTRFVNHRWIMLERDLRKRKGEPPGGSSRDEVSRECQALARRFGKSYRSTYGWASALTKSRLGVVRPQFRDLERLLDSGGQHLHRVLEAHHAVHADSIGVLYRVDASDRFHAGATSSGLASGCFQSIVMLGHAVTHLLRGWNKFARSPRMTDVLALLDVAFSDLAYQALLNAVAVGDIRMEVVEDMWSDLFLALGVRSERRGE